jgi:hypothetical protein
MTNLTYLKPTEPSFPPGRNQNSLKLLAILRRIVQNE